MDHTLKILLGTLLSFIVILIFYSLFDRFYRSINNHHSGASQNTPRSIPIVFKRRPEEGNEDSGLIYEEYADSDPVAVVLTGQGPSVGVALFPSDLRIEYFISRRSGELSLDSVVSAWSGPWSKSLFPEDSVHILHNVREVVQAHNNHVPSAKEEDLMGFRVLYHWTDNFFCEEGFNAELWEDLIVLGRNLRDSGDREVFWEDFICGHWDRERVNLEGSPSSSAPAERGIPLIDLS